MIQFATKPPRAAIRAIADAANAAAAFRDPGERLADELTRLSNLIGDALPPAAVREDWARSERDAEKIIAHMVEFEGAKFSKRAVNGSLYGLRMAGITASSTSSPIVLLRNWQRTARQRIEALS